MSAFVMGLDIGSTSSKCVVMDEIGQLLEKGIVSSGTGTEGPAKVIKDVLTKIGLQQDEITLILATGYGRYSIEGARLQKSEISCHAKGAYALLPSVRTVIDIGGQDVKIISLAENGGVKNFVMNDKCAAGTGRFLETMSKILALRIDQFGDIARQAEFIDEISSTCTVFAESEVISKLSRGVKIANLVAGIHQSVAKRIAALAYRINLHTDIVLSGGVALNSGVHMALEKELQKEIIVQQDAQFIGAIGASLYALEALNKRGLR